MPETTNEESYVPTATIADGLKIAVEKALRHAVTYHAEGATFRDKVACRASAEIACQRLMELEDKLRTIWIDYAEDNKKLQMQITQLTGEKDILLHRRDDMNAELVEVMAERDEAFGKIKKLEETNKQLNTGLVNGQCNDTRTSRCGTRTERVGAVR